MNWDAVSFDWNHLKAFVATAEAGSFSGAARALRSTQPTVGRQVTGLEQALGVTLFERSVRGLTLTAVGRDLLDHAQAMSDAASRMSLVASGQSQDVSGTVTITASDLLCAAFLPKVLVRLRAVAPALRIELRAVNQIEDLMRRAADIAVRHVRPDQPDLIARHVADWDAALLARHSLVETVGTDHLERLPFVSSGDVEEVARMIAGQGVALSPDRCVLATDSGVMIWEGVRAGLGAGLLPKALCGVDPLVGVYPADQTPLRFPVWLVTHRELQTARRIRVVYDVLAEALSRPDQIVGSP